MFKMTNKQYNFSKWAITVCFPAFTAFYLTISQIWGIPGSEKVVGTLAAFATFGGVVMGISSKKYNAAVSTEEVFEENPPEALFLPESSEAPKPPFP